MYKKIKTLDQILKLPIKSKKIVLVTGVFDLLHDAHKKFLKKAKSQGDILLVGLEQDERVKKLKGKDRPINLLPERLKQISDLIYIDFAFPLPLKFDSPKDHKALIKKLKPDILAVSSNSPNLNKKQKITDNFESKLVIVMQEDQSISTTKIIEKAYN